MLRYNVVVTVLTCLVLLLIVTAIRLWNLGGSVAAGSNDLGVLPVGGLVLSRAEYPSGKARATFRIVNNGRKPMKINDVVSSCNCTVPSSVRNTMIASRSSIEVPLHVTLPEFGNRETKIDVLYSTVDGMRSLAIPIRLSGAVASVPTLSPLPKRIEIDLQQRGDTELMPLEVRTIEKRGSPWLTGWSSTSQDIGLRIVSIDIVRQFDEDLLERAYSCSIHRLTDEPLRATCVAQFRPVTKSPPTGDEQQIVCRVSPCPSLLAVPEVLFFDAGQSDAVVTVRNRDGSPIASGLHVLADDRWVSLVPDEDSIGRESSLPRYRVRVQRDPESGSGPLRTTIQFCPADPALIATIVPVTIAAESGRE